jgi:hypothetical protein
MSARMSKREMDEISKNSRVRFHGGDKQQLMDMIIICCELNAPLPSWVSQALQTARYSKFKSWDEIFGKPVRMKTRLERMHRRAAWLEVRRLKKRGLPVDEALFQKAAENLQIGIGGSTVRNLYYDFEHDRKSLTGADG